MVSAIIFGVLSSTAFVVVMGVLLALCLRSRGNDVSTSSGPRSFYVHPGWFVFCGIGGVLVVGIFAFAATQAVPEDRVGAVVAERPQQRLRLRLRRPAPRRGASISPCAW